MKWSNPTDFFAQTKQEKALPEQQLSLTVLEDQMNPAVQAWHAHQEVEKSKLKQVEFATLEPTVKSQSRVDAVAKPNFELSSLKQSFVTNLVFALVFVAIGFAASELRHQRLTVSSKTTSLAAPDYLSHEPLGLGVERFVVVSSILNIRKGPGLDYDVLTQKHRGSELWGTIYDGQWVQLGSEAFVFRSAIELKPAASYWTKKIATPVYRSDAKGEKPFKTLAYGARLSGQHLGEWFRLSENAFVKTRDLSRTAALRGENFDAKLRLKQAKLRATAGRKAPAVEIINSEDLLRVASISNGWARLERGGYLPAAWLYSL